MERPSESGGAVDTTGGSGVMGVPPSAGEYGREGSDGSDRSRVIVHGRRPQKVVQEGLQAPSQLWAFLQWSTGGHLLGKDLLAPRRAQFSYLGIGVLMGGGAPRVPDGSGHLFGNSVGSGT